MAPCGTDFRAARDAVWASSLPPVARFVAMRLVEHLPNATPSVASLAEHTGYCERAVRRALVELEKLGVLVICRSNGRRSGYSFGRIPPRHEEPQHETPRSEMPRLDVQDTPAPDAHLPRHEMPTKQTREAGNEADKISSNSVTPKPDPHPPLPPAAEASDGNRPPQRVKKTSTRKAVAGGPPTPGEISVFEHWKRVMSKGDRTQFSPERLRAVRRQIASGRTVEDICRAIDGCAKSDFHMGRQPGHPDKHVELELICRDAKHLEGFLELAERPPARPRANCAVTPKARERSFHEAMRDFQ
jgi:hypothetical protein